MSKTEFKLTMKRGEDPVRLAYEFSEEPPKMILVKGGKKSSYLWVGGENGPCYATLSGQVALRKLAKAILAEVGE